MFADDKPPSITPTMDDGLDLHRHFGTRKVWEKYNVPKSPTISISEIWVDDESHASVVESRAISSYDVDNWLQEPSTKHILTEDHTRALRIAWVGLDPSNHRHSPSTRDLERLLSTWDLQDGYDYALSCYAGVSALPSQSQTTRTFTATYHPKLAIAWSHTIPKDTPTAPQTNMFIFAEGEERTELLAALSSKWSPSLTRHAMFPAFLCTLMLSQELDTTLEDIKNVVRNVEARTGHHRFTTRRQTRPAAGELGSLSAEMSGCAAKLANGTRKLKVVEAINGFILSHDLTGIITNHITLLTHRSTMQAVDNSYVQQRIQVQIAALFHLIAQQDNAIAFETASATRSIAKDSLQDSSAMKMLALVTMFFLPGSFVASLFSAPLFDWEGAAGEGPAGGGIGVGTRPQFKLFWVVAVPLTVGTFVLYAVWIVLQRRRLRRRLGGGIGGV